MLAGLFEMGPLPLPLNLASLIACTHLQRSAEAQTTGQRVSVSPHTGMLQKAPWMGWRGLVQGSAGLASLPLLGWAQFLDSWPRRLKSETNQSHVT